MDPYLAQFIKDSTPKMNSSVLNGLAVEHLPHAMRYIEGIVRNVFNGLLPGLKFERMIKCSPEEELRKEQRRKNDKLVIDIARSDLYLVGLDFSYVDPTKIDPLTGKPDLKPQPLQRKYLFLPFAGPAGSITLSGSRYFISPVISDIVLSFERESVFVRLLRDKFAVKRVDHTVYVNNRITTIPVIWSEIYHLSKERKKEKTNKALCPLMLYLLCRYGLKDTLKKFGATDCIVGNLDTVNSTLYPDDKWSIFQSSRALKRRGMKNGQQYVDFRVAVPIEKATPYVHALVGSLFYLLDHFPDKFENIEWLESKEKWMLVMGYIYFGETQHRGILLGDIQEHFKSIDEYLDTIILDKLESVNIKVNDTYELFALIIERFGELMISTSDRINSLYDKELSILYDVLIPVTSSIFNCYFKLKSSAKSNAGKGLSVRDIEKIMEVTIRARAIFGITKTQNGISSLSYSGDNKFLKITSVMNPQKRSGGKGSSDDAGQLKDPEKRLHVSFVDVGNYSNLTGKTPVGSQRLNPYIQLDSHGRVLRSTETREALDKTQEKIRRM